MKLNELSPTLKLSLPGLVALLIATMLVPLGCKKAGPCSHISGEPKEGASGMVQKSIGMHAVIEEVKFECFAIDHPPEGQRGAWSDYQVVVQAAVSFYFEEKEQESAQADELLVEIVSESGVLIGKSTARLEFKKGETRAFAVRSFKGVSIGQIERMAVVKMGWQYSQ